MNYTDLETALISLVKPHPCLYDAYHVDFKCNYKREKIWEDIAEQLQITVEETKRRWKNLKDYYRKLLKIKTYGGDRGLPKKRWKYMKLLSFMADYPPPQKHQPCPSNHSSEADPDSSWTTFQDLPEIQNPQPDETISIKSPEQIKVEYDMDYEQDSFAEPSSVNQPPKNEYLVEEFVNDYWKKFFDSMAAQIERATLPQREELILQRKISNLIYYELDKYLSQNPK